MNKKIYILLFLGIYLITTGISFKFFSTISKSEEVLISPMITPTESKFKVSLSGPKNEVCPLNGVFYTKTEKDIWSTRRPLTVMIENHVDSRPQSGLAKADVVYEAVAEGAITRFLAVFYCGIAAYSKQGEYDIGPVRSARTYFLDWASEYGDFPLYNHVGGAGLCHDPTVHPKAKALCQIEQYGWKNKGTWSDLDQFSLGFRICRREPDRTGKTVATEHSMYCSTYALWEEASRRGLTNITQASKNQNSWDFNFKSWLFKEDQPSGQAISPEFDFWKDYGDYRVRWVYDPQLNSYLRYNGGIKTHDFYFDEDIVSKNVVIQFTKETSSVDEHKHNLYQTIGTGKALIFLDGKVIQGTWTKKSRQDRTKFFDSMGREIKFNRGQIWIEILPTTSTVTY